MAQAAQLKKQHGLICILTSVASLCQCCFFVLMCAGLPHVQVEQRKFMVQPFSMLTGASRTAAPESTAGSIAVAAGSLQEVTLNGGIAQQQRQQVQWQRSSSRLRQQQQHASILDTASMSLRWQQQHPGSRRQLHGGYSPYGTEQQQVGQQQLRQGQHLRVGEQQLGRGSAGSFGDAGRKQQQAKQKGRLGRMASRIYALRPRMLRGEL
jgi:hypothetical protein